MCAFVLLHIVLPCKGLLACGAKDILLAGVFFPVPRCVSGRRECVGAVVACGVRAWVFFLRGRVFGSGAGLAVSGGGCRGGEGGGDGGVGFRFYCCGDGR